MPEGAPFPDPSQLDLSQLMQSLAGEDPRMAMLARLMQAQRPDPSNDDVPDERDDLIAELSERLDAAEARLTKMTRIARQLHESNLAANNRLGLLAAALGACGLCWGEDDNCPGCRGRGSVGMIRPDPALRAELFGDLRRAQGERHAHAVHPEPSRQQAAACHS